MTTTSKQLDALIDRWCRENGVSAECGVSVERVDELKDHLACVAEAEVERGATVTEAMHLATKQFGDAHKIRAQLLGSSSAFRQWLACVHCKRTPQDKVSESKIVLVSLLFAAALICSAWLVKDGRSYAFINTTVVGVWIVIASRMGGTREAARAEWRWLKRKLGV